MSISREGSPLKFTVYKITCLVNGKEYIGKHQTRDLADGYMGSGKLLKAAIKKHGIENFSKEILYVFETEAEMNAKEAELVELGEHSYNLCPGGQGGWGYVNSLDRSESCKLGGENSAKKLTLEVRRKAAFNSIRSQVEKEIGWFSKDVRLKAIRRSNERWTGQKHTEKTKEKMSISAMGMKNSQHGTMWINDGKIEAKTRSPTVPIGWVKGRIRKARKS